MAYKVTQCGPGALEIKREFFQSLQEAMDYYGITECDAWFWDNYAIEESN